MKLEEIRDKAMTTLQGYNIFAKGDAAIILVLVEIAEAQENWIAAIDYPGGHAGNRARDVADAERRSRFALARLEAL